MADDKMSKGLEQIFQEIIGNGMKVQLTKNGELKVVKGGNESHKMTNRLRSAVNKSGQKNLEKLYNKVKNLEANKTGANHIWSKAARTFIAEKAGISDASAQKLGDLFEGLVAVALYNLANAENYVIADATALANWNSRVNTLMTYLNRVCGTLKAKEYYIQAEDVANKCAAEFWPSIRDNYINKLTLNQIGVLELAWMGGGGLEGKIGDLRLLIGDYVIMIECKYYAPWATELYGTKLFTLSDHTGNFGNETFWKFLQMQGISERLWMDPYHGSISHEEWLQNVLTKGFQRYIGKAAGQGANSAWMENPNQSLAVFNYILDKGSKVNVTNGFNFQDGKKASAGHRALIAADKVSKGEQCFASITINLHEIFTDEQKKWLSTSGASGIIYFYLNGMQNPQPILTLGIDDKSMKTIEKNSVFKSPMEDGVGWRTSFRAALYRDRLLSLTEIK